VELVRARGTILRALPFILFHFFGGALLPVAAFHDAGTTEASRIASIRTRARAAGRDVLPGPPEFADTREGEGAHVIEVPVSEGGLKSEGAIEVVTWMVV
jgi:hypothetical protein